MRVEAMQDVLQLQKCMVGERKVNAGACLTSMVLHCLQACV